MARAISGALGGALAMAVTYPLSNASIKLATESPAELAAHAHENVLETLLRMARDEGPEALYAGLESALLGTFLAEGIFYFWFSLARSYWRGASAGPLSPMGNLVVSCQAAVVNVFCTTPIWVVNNRRVTSRSHASPPSMWQSAREIFRTEGMAGLYRGLGPSLILVSNPIITYTVYESLKGAMPGGSDAGLSSLERFALAALAKLVATVITYPYVLVKSRMQKTRHAARASDAPESVLHALAAPFVETARATRAILASEGPRGLYHGLQAKIVQSVLRNAFLFAFEARVLKLVLALLRLIARARAV